MALRCVYGLGAKGGLAGFEKGFEWIFLLKCPIFEALEAAGANIKHGWPDQGKAVGISSHLAHS
jgi:hypothetical protein